MTISSLSKYTNSTLKLFIFSALTASCLSVGAQTLSATPSDKKLDDITLTQNVVLTDGDLKADLQAVSHGLRKKKAFGLVTVKVYAAEFFAAHPSKLIKEDEAILGSLKAAGPVQLRLTLTRDLSGKQIADSFKEALEANSVDLKSPQKELSDVLNEINEIKQFKTNETFSLTAVWKDSNATLYIQKPDGSIKKITGEATFVNQMFSIWFGTPADAKLGELKKALLK